MAVTERQLDTLDTVENNVAEHGTVQSSEAHYDDFRLEASGAREDELVFAETMLLGIPGRENGIVIDDFAVEAMLKVFKAAPAAAPKRYRIDCYTTCMTARNEPRELLKLFPWSARRARVEIPGDQEKLFNRFREIPNMTLEFTNPPKGLQKYFPVFGRNHLKNSGIGRRVFWVRGFNDEGFTAASVDFAVKFTGQSAGKLRDGYEIFDTLDGIDDYEVEIDKETRLIMDRGIPGQSRIYDTIIKNIKRADKSIKAMSSHNLDGEGAKALSDAYKEGKDVEVYISAEKLDLRHPLNTINIVWALDEKDNVGTKVSRIHFPVLLNQIREVHGKCWIFDDRVAIFGTHNASEKGIKAGTREAVVLTTNPKIVQGLLGVFRQAKLETYPDIKYLL